MLYIDLKKAVPSIPSTATDEKPERVSQRDYEESFARRSSGVAGGDASPGGVQSKGDTTSDLDDDLEDDRKKDSEIASERGIIGKPETKKSEAVDMLKSLSGRVRDDITKNMPNVREIEYLTTVRNYTLEDIQKGYAKITGYERDHFNKWLNERLHASINKLGGR